jgi:protein-serine/threonine kinase
MVGELDVLSSTQAYRVGKFVGAGAFSDVHIRVREFDGKTLALKAIKLDRLHLLASDKVSARKLFFREIDILKMLNHPNIVRLYDVTENDMYMFLIMVYVEGGDLFPYISTKHLKSSWSERLARRMTDGLTFGRLVCCCM